MLINYPTSKVTASTAFGSATLALPLNLARIGWGIQNVGTNALYINFSSTTTPTLTSGYHVALKASTTVGDGLGASFVQQAGVIYTGQITVGGTSPSYVVYEFAP